jgi:hypothetical protein
VPQVRINFELSRYQDLLGCMDTISLEELIMSVRRQSQGFSRGELQRPPSRLAACWGARAAGACTWQPAAPIKAAGCGYSRPAG